MEQNELHKQISQEKLAACIKLDVEINGLFRLYSHRLCEPEHYIGAVHAAVTDYMQSVNRAEAKNLTVTEDES